MAHSGTTHSRVAAKFAYHNAMPHLLQKLDCLSDIKTGSEKKKQKISNNKANEIAK